MSEPFLMVARKGMLCRFSLRTADADVSSAGWQTVACDDFRGGYIWRGQDENGTERREKRSVVVVKISVIRLWFLFFR